MNVSEGIMACYVLELLLELNEYSLCGLQMTDLLSVVLFRKYVTDIIPWMPI